MKKQALLIGLNNYEILPRLHYARQDAEAVAESLKQNYDFTDDEIVLLTDVRDGAFYPSNKNILEQIDKLANQELDLFVFGFWGHGLFRNGQQYFCPLDASRDNFEELGVSFDSLMQLLSKIKTKDSWVILDAIHQFLDKEELAILEKQDDNKNAARDIRFTRIAEHSPESKSNLVILNSCRLDQCSYDWDAREHGIFTIHLLDAMNKRFDNVFQIVNYVIPAVEKTAYDLGKIQTPFCKCEGNIQLLAKTESTPRITGDVFIAYRHCNADLVAPIEEELKRRGISYFIDRIGINYGMDYATTMAQAIKACKVLLFLWTKDVEGSPDLLQEIVLALQLKKRVLPYKIGSFDTIEHVQLCYQLAPLSRYETPCQTPESIADIVDRIEMILTGKN